MRQGPVIAEGPTHHASQEKRWEKLDRLDVTGVARRTAREARVLNLPLYRGMPLRKEGDLP